MLKIQIPVLKIKSATKKENKEKTEKNSENLLHHAKWPYGNSAMKKTDDLSDDRIR